MLAFRDHLGIAHSLLCVCRLHLDGVSTSEIDASDLKKWWSPLRLQVSAAARTVAHTLGEDNNVALQLKQIVEKILAQTQ